MQRIKAKSFRHEVWASAKADQIGRGCRFGKTSLAIGLPTGAFGGTSSEHATTETVAPKSYWPLAHSARCLIEP
jgi:hypothetical protein